MTTSVRAESNFLIPNGTFLAELVAFLIILAIFYRFVVPPLQRAMRERRELIRSQFEEARRARERAEAAEATYNESLATARAEAAQIREAAREQGQQIIDEFRASAQQEA
ncbi:MAG: F0F1 ATP synthase subunit B, partial [Actinobacteria bacterium]|nr:F0F1 ATP synthase subunit B [Actinomycetota bacterium]